MKLLKQSKGEMPLNVPMFGDFSLEQQPGGTLQMRKPLGEEKFQRVCIRYEKKPPAEHKMHFKLESYADSGDIPCFGEINVTFRYNEKVRKWEFESWEDTIGKKITPSQWEEMLADFFTDKLARKWLKDQETFGPPKESFFQRLRMG